MKAILILCLFLISCSPKGFDFKAGEKKGVNFKRSADPKHIRAVTLLTFFLITPVILIHEGRELN